MRKIWRVRSPSAQYLNVSQTLDEDAETVFFSDSSDRVVQEPPANAAIVPGERAIQLEVISSSPTTSPVPVQQPTTSQRFSFSSISSGGGIIGPQGSPSCTSVSSVSISALRPSSIRRSRESSLRVSLDLDPGILMVDTRAHALDDKYRFHAFVFYHPSDRQWVLSLVRRLEAPPHCFKCCYDLRDFYSNTSVVQNTVCAMMLSERIILVASPSFITVTWKEYEETLVHMTALTARKQRVIPILLEASSNDLPDPLRHLSAINAAAPKHWEQLLLALRHDGIPASDSTSTMWSVVSQPASFSNGHMLCSMTCEVRGCFTARLCVDKLSMAEVPVECLTPADVEVMLFAMGIDGKALHWQLSALPTLLLVLFAAIWCSAFLLVIFLMPDNTSATLPVRLLVIILPAAALLGGTFLRWRKLQRLKYRKGRELFMKTIHVNRDLFVAGRSILLTTYRGAKEDVHKISLLFYSLSDCVERLKLFLGYCRAADRAKLGRLISVYTLSADFMQENSLAERLAVMLGSAYAAQFITKNLTHPLDQRHTRRRQCLCQFAEDFLSAYLPMLRHEGAFDEAHLKTLFLRYLHCDVKPDQVVMRSLGIVGNRDKKP